MIVLCQLVLALWRPIFGVMHILRMRREGFEAAFGISREELFGHFPDMMRAALRGAGVRR